MADSNRPADQLSKRLLREKLAATSDPLRLEILTALARTPASSAQLAEALAEEPSRIRYVLRRMREVGLIDVAGETRARGVRENSYSVELARLALSDEEVERLKPQELDRALAATVRYMFWEAVGIVREPPTSDRVEFLTRFPLQLDAHGWRQAAALFRDVLGQVIEVAEKGRRRISGRDAEEIETVAMIVFLPFGQLAIPRGAAGSSAKGTGRLLPRQLRVLGDPLRYAIMTSLVFRPGSAADLSAELGLPIGQVRYQLRRLRAQGLVVTHSERPRRGTFEQTFTVDPRRTGEFDTELLAEFPGARLAAQMPTVRAIFTDMLEAIRAGAMHDNFDHMIARVPLSIDPVGYREVEAIMTRAMERLFELREQSLERLAANGADPRRALTAFLHLERPA